jgi:hypothetical protein
MHTYANNPNTSAKPSLRATSPVTTRGTSRGALWSPPWAAVYASAPVPAPSPPFPALFFSLRLRFLRSALGSLGPAASAAACSAACLLFLSSSFFLTPCSFRSCVCVWGGGWVEAGG